MEFLEVLCCVCEREREREEMMMMMSSTSASSSSATVAVEKATSELLMSPDWTMNIDICDSVNSHQWYGFCDGYCLV